MPEVVCFIGVMGSGKDFRAAELQRKGYARVDFKDELVDMVSDLCGWDIRLEYDWFKQSVVGVRKPANKLQEGMLRNQRAELLAAHPELMTGRRLLQRFGTEVVRKRDEDAWVKAFLRRAAFHLGQGASVVNADCRFHNEFRAIRAIGFPSRFVFCDYRSSRYQPDFPHESEAMAQRLLAMGLKDGEEIGLDRLEGVAA